MEKHVVRGVAGLLASAGVVGGIAVEQTIHLTNHRYVFGESIGNYFGDFTIGVACMVAGLATYSGLKHIGVSEKPALITGMVVADALLAVVIANEIVGFGPGSKQTLDLLAPLVAIVLTAIAGNMFVKTPTE